MLRPRMRYRNVRADVFDILQKDSRDGEVMGPNRPRGRFGAQESTSSDSSLYPFISPFFAVNVVLCCIQRLELVSIHPRGTAKHWEHAHVQELKKNAHYSD